MKLSLHRLFTTSPRLAVHLLLLLLSLPFYVWFAWERVPAIIGDQTWFLQVARRVANGDVLYRDILWDYGPLPVILVGGLDRLARYDIAYFSILNIALALAATLTLYALHRHFLSPRVAALATFSVMLGLGACWAFLRVYTPSVGLGLLALLVTLLGYVTCSQHRAGGILIALGVAVGLLTKLEYGLAVVVLPLLGLALMAFSFRDRSANPIPFRSILFGTGTGLLFAVGSYALIAMMAGPTELWNGLKGYELAQVQGPCLFYYAGTGTIISVLTAGFLLGIMALALYVMGARRTVQRAGLVLAAVGLVAYVLFTLAWATGWLSALRRGMVSPFDLKALWTYWTSSFAQQSSYYYLQIRLTLELALGVLLILLLWQLMMQVKQRAVRRETILGAVIAAFVLLSNLRIFFQGMNNGQLVALVPLGLAARSAFSKGAPVDRRMRPAWLALAAAVVLFWGWQNIDTALVVVRPKIPYETPYGTVRLDNPTLSLPLKAIEYVEANSRPADSIAVLSSTPTLYFLTERHNPFRQDYFIQGLGDSKEDARDYVARLEKAKPALVIVPQGDFSLGILEVTPSPRAAQQSACGRGRLFGEAAPLIEEYVRAHYRLDRLIEGDGWEFAAFKPFAE